MTTPTQSDWMLYGAYGSTGRLILDEALRRGHHPILAGRDSARLSALGQATGLRTARLSLEDEAALRAALAGVRCVLLAAGPYSLTGQPMRAACLDTGCSYLDIDGEIEDFAAALIRIAGPLLGTLLTWRAARVSTGDEAGPSAAVIAGLRSRVWAEAGNAAGQRVAAVLETGEGYCAAAVAAVCALELQLREPRLGALTPVQAFGADFALLVPGTRIQEL